MFSEPYIAEIRKQMSDQGLGAYEQAQIQLLMNLSNTVERLAVAIEMNTIELKKARSIIT